MASANEASVSFKLSRSSQKPKLTINQSVIHEEESCYDEESKTFVVKSIEGKVIQCDEKDSSTEKKPLVIPLSTLNDWKTGLRIKVASDTGSKALTSSDDLTNLAKEALLEDAKKLSEAIEEGSSTSKLVLSSGDADKIGGSQYAADDTVDYNSVPIEDFGMAMLRGMGWKEGGAIGLTQKRVVTMKDPEVRPKGLGLGADKKLLAQIKAGPSGESQQENTPGELKLKRGACVRINRGQHKDHYGKVESFDEDNARVIVKLAIKGEMCSISNYSFELVTEKEYEKSSKIINKAKYEEYKEKAEKALESQSHHKEGDDFFSPKDSCRSKSNKSSSKKRKADYDNKYERSSESSFFWVRPDIIVRIVDKKIRDGKYYKAKVKVIDVASFNDVTCRTEEGKILEGISQASLETVIPKSQSAYAMLLSGKYKGEIAKVVELDKCNSEATVQLLRRPDKLVPISYDYISEYVGDLASDDTY